MAQKKYTLPRHTNIAQQGSRIGAFLIDLAIFVAITLGFFFGCFQFVFASKTKPLAANLKEERIASQLFYENESGKVSFYNKDSDNKEFVDALSRFYLVYIPSVGTENIEQLNVEWFNDEILDVDDKGSAYFEYVKVGEEVDKNQIASIKVDVSAEDVNKYLQNAWNVADRVFAESAKYKKYKFEFDFYNSLAFVFSALIASSVTYILIPLLFKNGVTLGKKAFGLCLADIDGYKMRDIQLLMRVMPLDVVLLSMLIPFWTSSFVNILILLTVFLVSFSLAMASPKKCSLHDFTGRTIVVNARTSILFDNVADEEEYIANEDNLVVKESGGEEPDLRYEK